MLIALQYSFQQIARSSEDWRRPKLFTALLKKIQKRGAIDNNAVNIAKSIRSLCQTLSNACWNLVRSRSHLSENAS